MCTPIFRVRMIFRDNRVWSLPIFQSWLLRFYVWHFQLFLLYVRLNSCSNVWCFHLIVLLMKYARNRKRAACMFFRSAKTEKDRLSTRVLNKAWSPVRRSRALCPGFDELTITKITRKVNAPNIRRWKSRALCAGCFELAIMLCLTRASTGKTNY